MRTNVNEQAFKVIAASIADKVSADKIAADKKGQVITDPSDPKKFAVIFYDKNAKTLESIKATTTPDELKSTMDKISVLRKKRNDMEIELCKFKEAGDTDEVENREAEIETINADIRQLAESVGINESTEGITETVKIKVDSNEMDEGKIPNKPDMDKEEDMINALLEKYGLVEKKEKVQEVTEDKVTVDVEGVEKTVDVKKVDGKLEISIKTKEDEPAPAAPIVVEKPEADVSSPESAPAPEPLPEPEAEKSEVEKEEELEDVTPKTVESVEMLDNRKIKLEEIKEDKGVDIDMNILNEFTKRI